MTPYAVELRYKPHLFSSAKPDETAELCALNKEVGRYIYDDL